MVDERGVAVAASGDAVVVAVPEPQTYALLGLGLIVALAGAARRSHASLR